MDNNNQDEKNKLDTNDGFFFDDPTDDDDIFEELNISNKLFESAMAQTENRQKKFQTEGGRIDPFSESVLSSFNMNDQKSESVDGKNTKAQKDGQKSQSENSRGRRQSENGKTTDEKSMKKAPIEYNTAGTSIDRKKAEQEKAKKKKSKIRKIIFWTVLEIFTLAAIFGYGYFIRNWNRITRPEINEKVIENNNLSAEKKLEMEKGYWTIALFGVDGRSASSITDKGLNSDVIIIANINRETGDIKLVSVFRDTLLNISDKDTYAKANAAYSIGGPEQALAALNKNLDLNIKNYVAVNWKAVADGINILGGVDNIPISKAELYYINAYITETVKSTGVGSVQLKTTGEQHLDGVQAVAYARLRNMDNDYARTERQKRVIKACFEKAKTAGFSVLNNIMVVCFPQVATNIDLNDCVAMAQNITKYNMADTGGFPWQRGEATIGNKGDCVIPATLESNVKYLHAFLFDDEDYQPSDAVIKYSETIKELSGVYKEGQVIKSVRTDSGIIPRAKTEEEGQSDSENSDSGYSLKVDDEGNYIYETDEDGNIILPTDEDGKIIYPTDEDGNIIVNASKERPTDEEGVYYSYENYPFDPDDIDSELYEEGEYMINPDGSISRKPTAADPMADLDDDDYYDYSYETSTPSSATKLKTGYVTDTQGEMPGKTIKTDSTVSDSPKTTSETSTGSTEVSPGVTTDTKKNNTSTTSAYPTYAETGSTSSTGTGSTGSSTSGSTASPGSTDSSNTVSEPAYNSGSTSLSPGDYTKIGGEDTGDGPSSTAQSTNITDGGPGSIEVTFNNPSAGSEHP